MIPGAVYLNDTGGIPIADTLAKHPAGVMGARNVVVAQHPHGEDCDCLIAEQVQWKIRPDGSVGCTPGWAPRIYDGKLVMFTRVES